MGAPPPAAGPGETYYFAYGSMCNPVSLKRRGILPSFSIPAQLHGYCLEFAVTNGMANIAAAPDSSLHGILHLVTDAMFVELCKVEAVYDVVTVAALPYRITAAVSDDTPHQLPPLDAKVFIVPPGKSPPPKNSTTRELPSQRYITIITQGLKHYGADPTWIDHIAQQPYTPSRRPEEYRTLPVAPGAEDLPLWSLEQLAQHKGKRPVVYAIGRKVLQVDTSAAPDSPMVTILDQLMSGCQACYGMCMNLYDPALPEINTPADMTDAHYAWAEDMATDMGQKWGFTAEQIGWLDLDNCSSSSSSNGTLLNGSSNGAAVNGKVG